MKKLTETKIALDWAIENHLRVRDDVSLDMLSKTNAYKLYKMALEQHTDACIGFIISK